MFYDQTAFDYLVGRIGWAEAVPPTTIVLTADNLESTSGRFFWQFFKMATVENVQATMPNAKADMSTLNDYLFDLKKDAVQTVLAAIFDENERANYRLDIYNRRIDISGVDYSGIIVARDKLFDNCIGYAMAYKTTELFISTARMNASERSNKFDLQMLLSELHGFRDTEGKITTEGLFAKYYKSIKKVINILFPEQRTPALIGRHPW